MENKDNLYENFDNQSEDIFSDTEHIDTQGSISLSSFTGNGKYAKKSHNKIVLWWKKRKKWQKTAMITAASLVLVATILLSAFFIIFDYNYNSITNDPDDLGFSNEIDKDIVNIALFGIDTRDPDSFKGLSDSIMILSLNANTKKVKIISVMRDTFVPIQHKGKTTYGKINSAYQKGGPELAIKTLNTVFGLDISEYATVNFFGMVDIIDAVGGIDAEITKGELADAGKLMNLNDAIDEICKSKGIKSSKQYHIKSSGAQHLNGIQAVAYSRLRFATNIWGTSNDYGRTDRQRHVMEQLFNKALTLEKSQYPKLVKSLIPFTETSLSFSEIMGLAFDILLASPTFDQTRIPQTEYQMRFTATSAYGSVVYFDLDFASDLIHAFIYDDITQEDYIAQNGVEKNDWYRKLFPSSSGSTTQTPSSSDDSPVTPEKPVNSEESSSEEGSSSELPTESNPSSSEPTSSEEESEPDSEETSGEETESSDEESTDSKDENTDDTTTSTESTESE